MNAKLECTFYRPEQTNLEEFGKIIKKLKCDLEVILSGEVSKSEIYRYCYALAQKAEPLEDNAKMYFWGLDDPKQMPGDARVDFFYQPSYVASANLMKSILICPEILSGENYEGHFEKEWSRLVSEVLPKALLGCTGRGFAGHGYEEIAGMINVMNLFIKADVPLFLAKYPHLCPKFTQQYEETLEFFKKEMESGGVIGPWGEDYTDKVRKLLDQVK